MLQVRLLILGLILLALLAVCGPQAPSYADKWEFLGKHEQGDMYLDTEDVDRSGDTVTFWAKRLYYKQQTGQEGWKYDEQRVRHEVDCHKQTVTFVGIQFYNDGKLVAATPGIHVGPKPIEPAGFIVKEADMLCPETANAGKQTIP